MNLYAQFWQFKVAYHYKALGDLSANQHDNHKNTNYSGPLLLAGGFPGYYYMSLATL